MYEEDTIAAIATPLGEGAISIVRLSGSEALAIASKVCRTKLPLDDAESHTIHYGHVIDTATERIVDEVLVSIFRAPKTFTREDVVEINCHGGIVVTNSLLEILVREGARIAEPGEFTKRAFLNGRIDLSQAEAVMDLIRSKTDEAAKNALGQLDGGLSDKIRSLRQELLEVLAQVEVTIDYPEYEDVEEMTYALMEEKVRNVKQTIDSLLQTSRHGKILREGVATAIIGRPNVGKSSLLNYLVQEDKAIVTEIAGTTRDVIEEYVNVRGIPLRLIDTAGIRETDDIVEKIGVDRSRKALDSADLVLLVLNQNEALTKEDQELLEATSDKERIIVVNKSELNHQFEINELPKEETIIEVSVVTDQGLDTLEIAIEALFTDGTIISEDATYLSNTRHIALFQQADSALDDLLIGIENSMPIDLLQIDLTRSWELLGEIVGDAVPDELITELFSQFCLGK